MASQAPPLFTLPIAATPPSTAAGSLVATSPHPGVYLLTFSAPPDNRLTTAFTATVLRALDTLEFAHPPGVVVTTSALPKFFSNGLDLAHAAATPGFWSASLYALLRRFLTYPHPTVALLNGHAFAGGLMWAMAHDYRVMNPARGYACLNELDFGAPLKPAMSAVFRDKCAAPAYRALVLEARRFGGPEALAAGVVDAVGGLDEVLRLVDDRKLVDKGKSGIYGVMKAEMYRMTIGYLDGHDVEEERQARLADAEERRIADGKRRAREDAAGSSSKARL